MKHLYRFGHFRHQKRVQPHLLTSGNSKIRFHNTAGLDVENKLRIHNMFIFHELRTKKVLTDGK